MYLLSKMHSGVKSQIKYWIHNVNAFCKCFISSCIHISNDKLLRYFFLAWVDTFNTNKFMYWIFSHSAYKLQILWSNVVTLRVHGQFSGDLAVWIVQAFVTVDILDASPLGKANWTDVTLITYWDTLNQLADKYGNLNVKTEYTFFGKGSTGASLGSHAQPSSILQCMLCIISYSKSQILHPGFQFVVY